MAVTQIIKRNGEIINLNTKEPFCVVKQATQTSSLMGDDFITLQIVSDTWLSFSKGDKIIVDGFDYTIRTTTTREIQGENYYTFEPVFYGPMYDLIKTIYRNCDKDGKSDRSTFDLTYTMKEFMRVLIYNLNRDYPGLWTFDEQNCPDTEAITIQFSGVNCLQTLQSLCKKENFNLEFLISQKDGVRTIHIGKFGQRVNPPGGAEYFEWGKGNGLYKLKEQKIDDKAIITRLWVEGGTTNIRTNYRNYSERLQLPFPIRKNKNKHVLYDGTVIAPNSEYIGIKDDTKRFIEDADLRDKIGSEEDTKTYDNIYPTRTGKVTALVDGDINAFIDSTMDFDLNAKNENGTIYLVDGVTAKINFTSGLLAGQQFELEAKGGYDNATKTFRLIPFTDRRGLTIPTTDTEAYRISVGDTYKITDIFLPESYEQNAEEDLWYAAMDDFKPATQAKAQYTLTLDRLYFLEALDRDTEVCVFKVGDYVPVRDTRYGIAKQIRIQRITRNLLLEQDYQITLSDTTAISIQTQTVLSVIEHDQIIAQNRLRDLNKARRGWRTTEDLRNMVYDTDGYFDIDNIRPNSIDTNMLTVGSKSQQFVLTGVILQANVGGDPNSFSASAGILSHLTIDPDKIRAWEMKGQVFTLQNTSGYYVFAKCSKTSTGGVWVVSQTQYPVEPTEDPNNYYFLVGIIGTLHSDDNFRDFTTTYGFTRINGNTITTGRIVTSDGECYLDLDGNRFRIGDASSSIDWNVTRDHGITLKNVSLVSESGDVSPLGVYRGVWNADYVYYLNDEVSYTENGVTCTYRYIYPTPSKGHKPTDSTYWAVVAQGANGVNGDWVSYVFKKSDTKPTKPSGTATIPSGWSDAPSGDGKWWMSKAIISGITGKAGEWSDPVQTTGEDGVDGPYTDFKYRKNTSETKAPDIVKTDRSPANWTDNPPTLGEGEYLWMSKAEINADNTLKTNWSDPVRISGEKGANGDWVSYVFKKSDTKPTKPSGTATIPSGWSDAPSGDGKWWMSKAIISGITGKAGEWSDPVQTTGEDGVDGPYTDFKYRKNTSETKAPDIVKTDRSPANWTDNPPTLGEGEYLWMSKAEINADNTLKTNWSDPVRISGEKGPDGIDGKNGDFTEYRYAVNGSKTVPPTLSTDGRNPSGWSTSMPTVGALQYLWLTSAQIYGNNNLLKTSWSTPIRITPYDGKDGAKGDNPALVYRGAYNDNDTYYGTKQRVDAVKFNNHYYVRALNEGTCKGTPPASYDNTNKKWVINGSMWNDFGAEFESIATGFLLAENANIANLIFRNERLESQSQTNGVPNFFLDGLNNIASFAAGNVVFDKGGAKIGWLKVIGKDLVGYDDSGVERLRLTPNALPGITSKSTELAKAVSCGGGSGVNAQVDQEQMFYAEKSVSQSSNRDDGSTSDNGSMSCWVDIEIPSDSTTLYLTDMQYGCVDAQNFGGKPVSPSCSITTTVSYKDGDKIGNVNLSSSSPQINIPKAGTIRISFYLSCAYGDDWRGRAFVSFQGFPISVTANYTVIGKDGIMAVFNGNYMRMHSTEGFKVKTGSYQFRINSNGIHKSSDGSTWTTL